MEAHVVPAQVVRQHEDEVGRPAGPCARARRREDDGEERPPKAGASGQARRAARTHSLPPAVPAPVAPPAPGTADRIRNWAAGACSAPARDCTHSGPWAGEAGRSAPAASDPGPRPLWRGRSQRQTRGRPLPGFSETRLRLGGHRCPLSSLAMNFALWFPKRKDVFFNNASQFTKHLHIQRLLDLHLVIILATLSLCALCTCAALPCPVHFGKPKWADSLSQEFETNLGNMVKTHLHQKNTKKLAVFLYSQLLGRLRQERLDVKRDTPPGTGRCQQAVDRRTNVEFGRGRLEESQAAGRPNSRGKPPSYSIPLLASPSTS
ncbi:hypothetical protein AAY473_023386 [Plecturocebus cupreus]